MSGATRAGASAASGHYLDELPLVAIVKQLPLVYVMIHKLC